jgi:hypothetical protein
MDTYQRYTLARERDAVRAELHWSKPEATPRKRRAKRRAANRMRRDMRRPVTVKLADGTRRTVADRGMSPSATWPNGWHVCPFCLYPSDGYALATCANPGCLVNMTLPQLELYNQHVAEREESERRRAAIARYNAQAARESRERGQREYDATMAEVRAKGQCEACARHRLRTGGPFKGVRHRDPSNCPEARKLAERRTVFQVPAGANVR